MKKILYLIMAMLFVGMLALPVVALAEGQAGDEGAPFAWDYLATVGGAAAFALVVVQLIKAPLDKVWKIPTRVVVYTLCLIGMATGTYFTVGITPETLLLIPINAVVASLTAMGGYDVTFKKLESTD